MPNLNPSSAFGLLIAATLVACNLKTPPIKPVCDPLDATNQATLPDMVDGGYPETINIVDQDDDHGTSYSWADGQGYVLAPIKDVWDALQQGGVVADRRELSAESTTMSGVDPKADWSFILDCTTASSTGLSGPYSVEWRGSHTAGTSSDPTDAIVCGDLNKSLQLAGSDLMSTLSDSIVLTEISANVTQYSAIRHRGPLQDSGANCKQYVQDVYDNVLSTVHNNPDLMTPLGH